jgi:AraC-like DNA-binding protein
VFVLDGYFSNLLPRDKDFRISYVKNKLSNNQSINQIHEYYELFYQMSGERHYFVKDEVYNIRKGDVVLIDEYDLHKTTASSTPTYTRMLIHFRKRFLADLLSDIRDIDLQSFFSGTHSVISVPLKDQDYVDRIFFTILGENSERHTGYVTRIRLLMLDLFIFLYRSAATHSTETIAYHSPTQKKILQAAQYISSSYSDKLTLDNISSRFSISRYYFCRVFKETTGFSVTEYINSVRIKQAQQLLRETGLAVIDVALRVGYQNATHFSRIFRALLNCSPSEYRRLALSAEEPIKEEILPTGAQTKPV